MESIRIIGSYLSPYVRKVLVCLELKGLAYQLDPIVPFYGNDEFSNLGSLQPGGDSARGLERSTGRGLVEEDS